MAEVTIVYWRDIPAQVMVGKGRRAARAELPQRFTEAIDRAAMKVGAADTDAYLAEWRKAEPYAVDGEADEVARSEAERLDAEYDTDRIKALTTSNADLAELTAAARLEGMQSLRESAVEKLLQGITTYQEVLRVTSAGESV